MYCVLENNSVCRFVLRSKAFLGFSTFSDSCKSENKSVEMTKRGVTCTEPSGTNQEHIFGFRNQREKNRNKMQLWHSVNFFK